MLNTKSPKLALSKYDFYSVARDVVLMGLAFAVTHADMIESKLEELGTDALVIAFVLFAIVELGRKFVKDYTK